MKFLILLLTVVLLSPVRINSQGFNYYCAWQQEPEEASSSGAAPCFDLDSILDNDLIIYIKINIHYFVNDNCNGLVQQTGFKQEEVYKKTKDMFKELNKSIANNEVQNGGSGNQAPKIPFRFVLSGVYFHCETGAVAEYQTVELNKKYGVNKDKEINFYIGHFPYGATGIGYANDNSGAAVAFDVNTWWTIGNFYHELGHIFNIRHSFSEDGCDDTPRLVVSWDKNCNGKIDLGLSGKQKEENLTCWNVIEPGKQKGDPDYSDGNENNVHDCDEVLPCTPSPCCDKNNVDNNVMSYSANKSAITDCQLMIMLNYINNKRCSLVYKIGACMPTVAFVDQLPEDKVDQSRCRECLRFEGSWAVEEYEFKIYEKSGPQKVLIYQSNHQFGEALNFCYKIDPKYPGTDLLLNPNTDYEVVLNTYNDCSEDQYVYNFRTNPGICNGLPGVNVKISPNPITGPLVLNLSNEGNPGMAMIWVENINTKLSYHLTDEYLLMQGSTTTEYNIDHLPSGAYVLYLLLADELVYQNFLKL